MKMLRAAASLGLFLFSSLAAAAASPRTWAFRLSLPLSLVAAAPKAWALELLRPPVLAAAAPAPAAGAFEQLLGLAPSGGPEWAPPAVPAAQEAPAPVPALLATVHGKDLSPSFSDPGRVRLILALIADIRAGKPRPFPNDGEIFENREGRLPPRPRGYYREYTVAPPDGSPSRVTVGGRTFDIPPRRGRRGAERLIVGGGKVSYYSPNHYRDFIELRVLRDYAGAVSRYRPAQRTAATGSGYSPRGEFGQAGRLFGALRFEQAGLPRWGARPPWCA